jgi:hypothetical protein
MTLVSSSLMVNKTFSFADQEVFGRLSGDINPIHIDRVAARRSVVGAIVVHGMHTLLWALDALAKSEHCPGIIRKIDVRFLKANYLDEVNTLICHHVSRTRLQLRVVAGMKLVATVAIDTAPNDIERIKSLKDTQPGLIPGGTPRDLQFDECQGQVGTAAFAAGLEDFCGSFPHAANLIGASALRGLAACSRTVGMECPGLRSVFARLTVDICPDKDGDALSYKVIGCDDRFRIVRLDVSGAGLKGRIEAFAPAESPKQITIGKAAQQVERGSFANQTALIVGGSRGLGEVTAKLIAGGGGNVVLTYAVGKSDAESIAAEILGFGGVAQTLQYDVNKMPEGQIPDEIAETITHVYYFATFRIAKQNNALFDKELLERFNRCYNSGFYELGRFLSGKVAKLAMFYPSSVYVDSRPRDMTEYSMAKAAGEILCASIPRLLPEVRVFFRRLPPLLTDQTASVIAAKCAPAMDVMIPIICEMSSM